MAGILSAIGNYVSEMLSPAFTPPRVEVPVDLDDPDEQPVLHCGSSGRLQESNK